MSELIRSNKVTARHGGDGVIIGTFYKTHDKLGEVKSDDPKVVELGYTVPQSVNASEGVEPIEVTPKQKLDSFKDFLQVNATVFGFAYDPVDRRNDGNKYPSKYTEVILLDTASSIIVGKLGELVNDVQKSVDKAVADGLLAEGSKLSCDIGVGQVSVQEKYKNENLKYADVSFPVSFKIGDKSVSLNVKVNLVSGQIKKPRELDKYTMTITGLKTALIDGSVLPEAPKKAKEAKDPEVSETPSIQTAEVPETAKIAEASETCATQTVEGNVEGNVEENNA